MVEADAEVEGHHWRGAGDDAEGLAEGARDDGRAGGMAGEGG